ncbi:LOW QUALITY PROTEIN: telomere repeats-binding bouquet formation protein 2 [Amblyraja radiata]|uniref:LOW QUALITY PROTEIN: telomere repeats-binding bouquet formation protein 2 n=1 Tax=Amblyraja radiata TaxID=386614 RepID=UPI00140324A1|nr:LOW QUALITY PROTEIN: telomere repeats-binding bouquet formation protein 2 [Amblyraja radiata]
MHRAKKAWFSQSVSRHICDIWVNEGGIITNWCAADFLFSNDASHPDTQRVFESLDFVEDKATVFHASYLVACEESGLRGSVAMGHFLLPPSCLIKPHEVAVASREKQRDVCHGPVKGRIEQVEMEAPNCGDSRSQHLVIGTPSFEAAPCHVQQMYPVNNMVTGFISIDELKKYSGNLNDFIPGCAQYSVCRVQRERNVFSLLRSKKRNPTFIHTH